MRHGCISRVCTVVHYAVLEKPFAQYMEYGKFDPSVNRKRLKILRSRLGYIITLRSRVVVQNLTKSVNLFWLGKWGKFQFFFLQAQNQTDRQTARQSNNFFVSCTDHKYRNMLSIWSSKHVVSRSDVVLEGNNI